MESVREILTSDGRTKAQGALGWLWVRSEHTLPIPGFRTVSQVEENCGTMQFGPLAVGQMREIRCSVGEIGPNRPGPKVPDHCIGACRAQRTFAANQRTRN